MQIKVIDFGISGICTAFVQESSDCGTIAYMPPECFEGSAVSSPAIDIWAIGMVFYALLFGTLPFIDKNDRSEKKLEQRIRT